MTCRQRDSDAKTRLRAGSKDAVAAVWGVAFAGC